MLAAALLLGTQAAAAAAVYEPNPASTVVVTATRVEQPDFDLPVSIDRIDSAAIHNGQPEINVSESLVRVPGVVAHNRQNYAQDLQISVRGFGSRSTFGVRGVRLYADGIPATMPDGQGQLSHFDLGSADHIEVLRGPFSALYGNSSGGVIALFTEDGKPGVALDGDVTLGSYNTRRSALKVSGAQGGVNYVVSGGDFRTDGYRDHSAAQRDNFNGKVRFDLDAVSQLTLVANTVYVSADDPLGLSRDQYASDARGVDRGALLYDTRKTVRQQQAGLNYQRQIDADNTLKAMVYRGHRDTVQFQSIPKAAQTSPANAGGVIDLDRDYWGADMNWTWRNTVAGAPLQITGGLSYDTLGETRRGYQNFVGDELGVRGALRRDERNTVWNFDQYLQAQLELTDRWLLMAGVRNSTVRVRSRDHYIVPGNGNDSGSTEFNATTPVLGLTYEVNPALNLYVSYGRGFETPTLNELAYRSTNGALTGLNLDLKPSRSSHYEAGLKARVSDAVRANLAVFHVDTRDELAVAQNQFGRSVYQNVGRTRRDGLEFSVDGSWDNGIGVALAYTLLRARYAHDFNTCGNGDCTAVVPSGNYLPGVPTGELFGELSWRHARSGFSTALEVRSEGRLYVNDFNDDSTSGFTIYNVRAGFEQNIAGWHFKEFVRVENLTDRRYVGSVIVNESNGRYFEPAPGRNHYVGLSAGYAW